MINLNELSFDENQQIIEHVALNTSIKTFMLYKKSAITEYTQKAIEKSGVLQENGISFIKVKCDIAEGGQMLDKITYKILIHKENDEHFELKVINYSKSIIDAISYLVERIKECICDSEVNIESEEEALTWFEDNN